MTSGRQGTAVRRRSSSTTPPAEEAGTPEGHQARAGVQADGHRPQARPEGREAEPRRRLPAGQGAGVHRQRQGANGGDRSNKVLNGQEDGNIEGITKGGDARHGTEVVRREGESFLGAHQLPTTKDTHVKADGSNKDNVQWFAGEAGKHLWFLPGVSNVLTRIGNSEGGFKGVLEGAATGYFNTVKGAAEGVIGGPHDGPGQSGLPPL